MKRAVFFIKTIKGGGMLPIDHSCIGNGIDHATIALRIYRMINQMRKNISVDTVEKLFVNLYMEQGSPDIPAAYSFDYSPFNEFDTHTFFEVAIQICESSLLQIGNRYYELNSGQLAIIPRNEVHRLGFDKEKGYCAAMLWLNVTGNIIRSGYTIYEQDNFRKIWGCDLIIPGGFIISEIFDEIVQEPVILDRLEAIVIYIQFFLMQLERKLTFVDEASEASWNEQVANEIKQYINNHLSSTLRLRELADIVSISACHLSKIFKQATDQTITGYIQQVKMEKAIEYLFNGSFSISQISSMLGFYDQYHFSKAFKMYTGYSPTIYRNTMSKEQKY